MNPNIELIFGTRGKTSWTLQWYYSQVETDELKPERASSSAELSIQFASAPRTLILFYGIYPYPINTRPEGSGTLYGDPSG